MASPTRTLPRRRVAPSPFSGIPRALADWLTRHGESVAGALTVARITTGRMNISSSISDGEGREWILRERRPGTIRDFAREATILRSAGRQGLPLPRLVGDRHRDGDIPFIVTARATGRTLHVEDDAECLTPTQRRRIGFNVISTLAQLHQIDPATVGLPRFVTSYIDRQLAAMTDLWMRSGSGSPHDSAWRALRARLVDCRPLREDRPTLVHGDFRMSNLVLHGGEVSAVIDWDCCTAGHPLADLAWLLVDWRSPGEPAAYPPSPTRAGEFPMRGELINAYGAATNRKLHDLPYYRAMAHWRAAALLQAELNRQHADGLDDPTPRLDVGPIDDTIADLLVSASNFLRKPR